MLLLLPGLSFFFIILLAVLPAIFLMRYIYRQDKVEKEPARLLVQVTLMGVVAAFASMILESIGQALLGLTRIDPESPLYTILLAFLVVAVVEEGTKYFFMNLLVWKNPAFNYRFDGVVYAVFASLGFAAMENIMYVFGYGLNVLLARALLAIPGHMCFGVVFGIFYGHAKQYANQGRKGACAAHILLGYLIAVLFHGFYDSCAMIGSSLSAILFAMFIVVIYVVIFLVARSESKTDRPI